MSETMLLSLSFDKDSMFHLDIIDGFEVVFESGPRENVEVRVDPAIMDVMIARRAQMKREDLYRQ